MSESKARERREAEEANAKLRLALFAIVRMNGRVRIPPEVIAAIQDNDGFEMVIEPTTGEWILTYKSGATDEPAGPPRLRSVH